MLNPPRILIIEDEPEISSLVAEYLKKEGYDVVAASTGEEGIKCFDDNSISLLILDLMLPDTDGLEVCRKIRSVSNIPILILTARDGNTDKILGLGIGADDYMTKPFDIHECIARTKALLRRYLFLGPTDRKSHQTILEFPGLKIVRDKHQVTANDKEVHLTVIEFDLLVLLADHPGKVFTKQQIISQVWADYTYLDDNTLSVHVRRLRKKIEKESNNPLFIQTIRGIGYKFNDRLEKND